MHCLWYDDVFLKLCRLCEATTISLFDDAKIINIREIRKTADSHLKLWHHHLCGGVIFLESFRLVCPARDSDVLRPI